MAVTLDAGSRIAVLEDLFRGSGARRLTATVRGPAAQIAEVVTLDLIDGRLIDASAGRRTGVEALLVLALADEATVETAPLQAPDADPARLPDAIGLARQAEVNASELLGLVAHAGGLGGVPATDLDHLVERLAGIPDVANAVLRLVDNASTTAAILGRSPHGLRLTARILHRLALDAIVLPPRTVAPPPLSEQDDDGAAEEDEVVAPARDEMEGADVDEDVRRWLENEAPPDALLDDDAFTSAFTPQAESAEPESEEPVPVAPLRTPTPRAGTNEPLPPPQPKGAPRVSERVRQGVPLTTTRPGPALESDDDFLAAAGVGQTRTGVWIALAAAGIAIGVLGSILLGGEDDLPPPVADAGLASTSTAPAGLAPVETTTTASAAFEILPDGRPAIAGPDAPEDVKRAEALLNAGRYAEARSLLAQLRETRPGDATVWILAGQVEVDVGRLSAAGDFADEALEIEPRSYRGWVLKGSVLQFSGRFARARRAYERAIELGPDHPMTPEIQSVLDQMRAQ